MNIHGCQLHPKIAIYVVKQLKNDRFRQGLYTRCSHVVRDFESEAKLGVTFNFDKFGWQTKAKMRRYPGKPEAVIFWPFLQAIIGIYVQGKMFIEAQSGRRL